MEPVSAAATLLGGAFTLALARRYARGGGTHHLWWAAAMTSFTVATAIQTWAASAGWTSASYKTWYFTGAAAAAALLGQGSVSLLASGRVRVVTGAMVVVAAAGAAVLVVVSPAHLQAGIQGTSPTGRGFPALTRAITPFFNVYGTMALVWGAGRTLRRFLWFGGPGARAAGTVLVTAGALVVAGGGTASRLGIPEPLAVAELAGSALMFGGFLLAGRRAAPVSLGADELSRRRRTVNMALVGTLPAAIFAALAVLPALPWALGITGDFSSPYLETVPARARGAYLVTARGVLQLYPWDVDPSRFPGDAPTLAASQVRSLAVVQKQPGDGPRYRLVDLGEGKILAWHRIVRRGTMLSLEPPALHPGRYVLEVPAESMFGGTQRHYFRVSP